MSGFHTGLAPSPWVRRWAGLLTPCATVLDVACGSGRHLRWLASLGHRVTGVDRDAAALEPLRAVGEVIVADLEAGPWPLPGRQFEAVVVTNYLWRPRLPDLCGAVAPGGVLLYETFAVGNESVGRPANPAFLLRPGELLDLLRDSAQPDWRVIAFEDGFLDAPARFVQRIAAARAPSSPAATPLRHRL